MADLYDSEQDKVVSSKFPTVFYLSCVFIVLVTGYPSRQFIVGQAGLFLAGIGLLFSLSLLIIEFSFRSKLFNKVFIKRQTKVYFFLWYVFLLWGLISSLVSDYGSPIYQILLFIAVIFVSIIAVYQLVSFFSLAKLTFWVAFPFTLFWWLKWLSEGTFSTYTYRNPSYGVVSLVALATGGYIFRFPINLLISGLILTSFFFNEHRASLLAGIVAIIIMVMFHLRSAIQSNIQKKYLISSLVMFIFAGLISYWVLIGFAEPVEFFLNKMLLWNDPNRGISSGFSSRVWIWKISLQYFFKRPILGWGARANEVLFNDWGSYYASSIHNGLFVNFIDYGFVGGTLACLLMLWPIGLSFIHAWKTLKIDSKVMSVIGISYLVLALGERYWFNMGNPTSLMILFILFFAVTNERE